MSGGADDVRRECGWSTKWRRKVAMANEIRRLGHQLSIKEANKWVE